MCTCTVTLEITVCRRPCWRNSGETSDLSVTHENGPSPSSHSHFLLSVSHMFECCFPLLCKSVLHGSDQNVASEVFLRFMIFMQIRRCSLSDFCVHPSRSLSLSLHISYSLCVCVCVLLSLLIKLFSVLHLCCSKCLISLFITTTNTICAKHTSLHLCHAIFKNISFHSAINLSCPF